VFLSFSLVCEYVECGWVCKCGRCELDSTEPRRLCNVQKNNRTSRRFCGTLAPHSSSKRQRLVNSSCYRSCYRLFLWAQHMFKLHTSRSSSGREFNDFRLREPDLSIPISLRRPAHPITTHRHTVTFSDFSSAQQADGSFPTTKVRYFWNFESWCAALPFSVRNCCL
jgi:hypothetical protein